MLSHLKNVHLKILERVQRHANPFTHHVYLSRGFSSEYTQVLVWYDMGNNCASGIGPMMGDFTLDVVTAPSLIYATISEDNDTLYLTREKV